MKVKKNISYLLLIAYCLLPACIFSQDECPSSSDEAVQIYKKSRDKKKYEYAERIKFIEQAVEEDPNYAPANYELGMHWQRRADESNAPCEKCEKYFLSVIKNCPKYHSSPYFFLGKLYFEKEQYDTSVKYMKQFLNFKEDDVNKYDKLRYDRFLVDAKRYIEWAKFYKETLGNPVPYDPKIVEGISTARDEYLPFISPDNKTAFFTRVMPVNQMNVAWSSSSDREVFCYSERQPELGGKFNEGQPMLSPPFNRQYKEGGASLTIDNKHLFYTVVDASGNFDIYTSDLVYGKDWSEVHSLGKTVNSEDSWDSQPSVSADGKTLYFASNRTGGYGGVDIWKTEKDASGNWQTPVNLGPAINTEGDEKSPFLHWDSKTLYFSSGDNETGNTSHKTLGGFDIFYSRQDSTGNWGKPKNIGFPINTTGDDVGFFVSADGKYGYFSSNNPQKTLGRNVGGLDIYYFEIPKQVRPDAIAIIKGQVTSEDGKPVVADVELKDAVTKKVTKAIVDTITGEYAVAANVQKKHDHLLIVKKNGFAFSSQLLSANDSSGKPLPEPSNPFEKPEETKTIELKTDSIKEGKAFTLNNIYFGPARADLKEESKFVLDEFAEYLKENPSVVIEIHGHTDDIGNDEDNQNLSAERAYTVLEYLHSKGISKKQIAGYRGWGESKPIAPNDTEEGRAKNRRTEFVIVGK